jgi:hypothetical protein
MARAFGLKKAVWIIIFGLFLLIPFCLLIASLASDEWFSQKWTDSGFDLGTLKGKVLGPKNDLGFCDEGDTFLHCYDECDYHCSRYLHWYYAGAVLVTFDSFAIVLMATVIVFLILELVRFPYFKSFINSVTAGFFLLVAEALHILAVVIFSSLTKMTYGSCSHDFAYNGIKSVCAEKGFNLSLSTLIITSVIMPGYFFIFLKLRSQENREEEAQSIPLT